MGWYVQSVMNEYSDGKITGEDAFLKLLIKPLLISVWGGMALQLLINL